MITTKRRQPNLKAYTIVESLVVLVVLSVLTMVLLALFKHEKGGGIKTGGGIAAPLSAPADPSPAPSIKDQEK